MVIEGGASLHAHRTHTLPSVWPHSPCPSEIQVAFKIYKTLKQYPFALRCAMLLNDMDLISQTMEACEDEYVPLGFAGSKLLHFVGRNSSGPLNPPPPHNK